VGVVGMAFLDGKDIGEVIEFKKVSPWFMWFIGFVSGFSSIYEPFKSHPWMWFVFSMVIFSISYLVWRIYYGSKIVK